MIWQGMCSYWTDAEPESPACPLCGSPMTRTTNRAFWADVKAFEADDHPGWREFVKAHKEECFVRAALVHMYDADRGHVDPESGLPHSALL